MIVDSSCYQCGNEWVARDIHSAIKCPNCKSKSISAIQRDETPKKQFIYLPQWRVYHYATAKEEYGGKI